MNICPHYHLDTCSIPSLPDRKTSRTALRFLGSFLQPLFFALFLSRGSQHVCVCVCARMCVRACLMVHWFIAGDGKIVQAFCQEHLLMLTKAPLQPVFKLSVFWCRDQCSCQACGRFEACGEGAPAEVLKDGLWGGFFCFFWGGAPQQSYNSLEAAVGRSIRRS